MINNELNLSDKIGIIDKGFRGTIICGKVEIVDKFNNLVLEKDNLVVLQGRGFVLKKLFNHPVGNILKTTIIGSGNTDIEVMESTVPALFIVGNSGGNSVETPVSFVPKFDDTTISSLFGSGDGIFGDTPTTKGKKFASAEYINNNVTNESYILLTLTISGADFGNISTGINEAGILFGNVTCDKDGTMTAINNLKLMSRLTFNTVEVNPGDIFTIRYYLYA